MSGFGGIISVRFSGGEPAARAFAESTELFALSVSLGGVESLVCYCSEMTHASVRGTALAVPTDLVRLSVGVEDLVDLQADLAAALARSLDATRCAGTVALLDQPDGPLSPWGAASIASR